MNHARRTRQRSVCVSTHSGPELAALAAHATIQSYTARTGRSPTVGAILHASADDHGASWSVANHLRAQLGMSGCSIAVDLPVAGNGVAALDAAAGILTSRPDVSDVMVTAGVQVGPRMSRYSDYDLLDGDAGATVLLSRHHGLARFVSSATYTDPDLAGYTRGVEPATAATITADAGAEPIDLRARKAAWLEAHGGVDEFLRRATIGVTHAVKHAVADAQTTLDDLRWILVPFLGHEAVRSQWLYPLGLDDDRTCTLLGLYYGHLGPCDFVAALRHLQLTRQLDPGDLVLLGASGAVMTWSAAVVCIDEAIKDMA